MAHSETPALPNAPAPTVRLAVRRLDTVDLSTANSLETAVLARADTFHRGEDRRRFLAGRLAVRSLVAAHLQVPESAVTAVGHCPDCRRGNDGSHGEPRYFNAGQPVPFGVSFSRSGNWLAAALAGTGQAGPRVGVDLEDSAAPAFADAAVEDVMATDAEKSAIAAVAARERPRLRAQLWVRKEALLKAAGLGLRMDPRTVETLPGGTAQRSPFTAGQLRAYDLGPEQLPESMVLSYAVHSPHGAVRLEFDGVAGPLPGGFR